MGHGHARWYRRRRWLARISAGDDLADEFRLPRLLGFLFGGHGLSRAPCQSEGVDRHAVTPSLVHQIEPPRMLAARARFAALRLARFQNCHVPSTPHAAVVLPPLSSHANNAAERIRTRFVPNRNTSSR